MLHLTSIGAASSGRPAPIGRPLRALAAAGVAALALTLAPAAQAAGPPTVTTGSAHGVTYQSATLTGSVRPNGSDTSYYFQYGPTRSYGAQTAIANAGAGSATVNVSLAASGLQPLTQYHYRLVAVNAAGPTLGSDRTFMTTKVPLSLAIVATPNPVLYGGTATVQGTLSGTENAGRAVILQANQFPFAAGFQNDGNPELTSATGGFSFPVLGLTLVTQFRVVTTTNPQVVSPTAVEQVAVRVLSHVRRTRRAHFARIYGTVTPAEDGAQVGILRITRGRGVLVGGTTLRHRIATTSTFSKVVRVRRGIYRVLVRVTSGAQVSSYSQPIAIR
ncbi:MAG TPA: hypothetical protein VMH33_13705 [Solirubrobacterales bacterium]|nr:hypothetical protein [Solirubrobacterales bacterium]